MSSKLEEVARAIAKDDAPQKTWADHSPVSQGVYRSLARAAIEAMREPTEHMVKSGHRGFCFGRPLETYQEMIDAALREEGR